MNGDVIILSSRDSTHKWNMFSEPRPEPDFIDDVRMLGRSLFPIHSKMSDTSKHFQSCARQLYEALFIGLKRYAEEEGVEPTNRDFTRFVNEHELTELYDFLCQWDDLKSSATHISPHSEKHAYDVFSSFQTIFTDIFHGDFAGAGDFSVREYMKNPNGKTLVLDMQSGVEAPIFRLLIDWAIHHALVDDGRRKFFLLDEFQQIPHLQRLQELVNTGRSYRAESLCGLQSIAQLQSKYSRTTAEGILAGFPQVVAHRAGDDATAHFVRSRIGRVHSGRKFEPWENARRYGGEKEVVRESYPISEQEVRYLNPGYAYSICENRWASSFRVSRLEGCREHLSEVYDGVENPSGYVLPVDEAQLVDFSDATASERTVESLRYRRDYSILVVGGTGSGKTTTLKIFAFQQRVNPDEPRVVFDYKEDWKKFYRGEDRQNGGYTEESPSEKGLNRIGVELQFLENR